MNERIKLLAEQAVAVVQNRPNGTCDMDKYNEKFAELIIRECIAQIQIESCNPYRNVEDIHSYGISACGESIYKIKLHFGVTE